MLIRLCDTIRMVYQLRINSKKPVLWLMLISALVVNNLSKKIMLMTLYSHVDDGSVSVWLSERKPILKIWKASYYRP